MNGTSRPAHLLAPVAAATLAAAPGLVARAATGGPDGWGYSWIDSDESALSYGYEYAPEPVHALGNEESVTVDLGFDFPFYGQSFSLAKVSANGVLHFDGSEIPGSNEPLPYESFRLIAPLWDNLNPEAVADPSTHGIYYGTTGIQPNRVFIAEWYLIPHYPSVGAVAFEVKLFEASGDIEFHYRTTSFGSGVYDAGASATVGIQDGIEGYALTFSLDEPSLSDEYAIRFVRCDDADGDGFADESCGGHDCDDGDDGINPEAAEVCDDGVDNDCDGASDGDDSECGDDDDAADDDDATGDDDDAMGDDDGRRGGPYGLRCDTAGTRATALGGALVAMATALAARRRRGVER